MNDKPLVSIIIPVYNGANYMREAINSALEQTYKHCEIIVVNDGSSDDGATEKIAQSYGNSIVYRLKENGGVATALNYGIQASNGEYISWLSHDDVYYPHKIEKQIEFLETVGKKTVLYSDFDLINALSNIIATVHVDAPEPEMIAPALLAATPIHGCTVLVPKVAFDTVGLFNPRLRTVQDYDMWLRFSYHYPFYHMREVLVRGRQHPEQDSVKVRRLCKSESAAFCGELIAVLHQHPCFESRQQELALVYCKSALGLLMKSHYLLSVQAFVRALGEGIRYRRSDVLLMVLRYLGKSVRFVIGQVTKKLKMMLRSVVHPKSVTI